MRHTDLLKFSIGLIGLSATIIVLVWGLVRRDHGKIKRALVIFLITWGVLLLFALVEFLFLI